MSLAITPDTLAPAAARLYEQWAHLDVDGEAEGYPWAVMAAVFAAPLEPLYALLHGDGVPWAAAFDPELMAEVLEPLDALGLLPDNFIVDMLAWLGQFAGVDSRSGLAAVGQRLRMRETAGARRGSVAAIIGAARQRLVGPDGTPDTATVYLTERVGGDPYSFAVATLASQTPDPAATERDIAEQVPAGRRNRWTYTVIEGGTWADAAATHATWADGPWATWAQARADPTAL